jgi:hypothetical protein
MAAGGSRTKDPLQIGLQLPMGEDWKDIGRFQDRFKFEIQNSRDALTPSKRVCIPHSIAGPAFAVNSGN